METMMTSMTICRDGLRQYILRNAESSLKTQKPKRTINEPYPFSFFTMNDFLLKTNQGFVC